MTVRRADVAKLAGTSPAVVSYVLNGGPRPVAPHTRERVLAAVEQLGYRPNGIARSLRMRRTSTFGLVIPDNANPFFAELARAIEDAAFECDYNLLIGNTAEDDQRQTSYVHAFLAQQVAGLLLVPAHGSRGCLDELQRTQTPWICLDRELPGATAPAVRVDNRGGGYAATKHLLDHGRRRIACLAGPPDVLPAADRLAGWRDALAEAGIEPGPNSVCHTSFGREAGYLAAQRLMSADDPPDAIFAASDEQAIGVLRALAVLGVGCPDQVAVAAFDGVADSAYSNPALTTVTQPFARIGAAAIGHLVDQMADRAEPPETLPVELVIRESCGCTPQEAHR